MYATAASLMIDCALPAVRVSTALAPVAAARMVTAATFILKLRGGGGKELRCVCVCVHPWGRAGREEGGGSGSVRA